jgi:hypothetical protein
VIGYTTNVDYLLCVIISHGENNGCFKDSDGEDISIDELVHIFNAENCKGLRNKRQVMEEYQTAWGWELAS